MPKSSAPCVICGGQFPAGAETCPTDGGRNPNYVAGAMPYVEPEKVYQPVADEPEPVESAELAETSEPADSPESDDVPQPSMLGSIFSVKPKLKKGK